MTGQDEPNQQWSKLDADASADAKLKQRLQAQPLAVLKEYGIAVRPDVAVKELGEEDLDKVTGGLKWTPGTKNDDVVDARGGQVKILGFTISLDRDGKVSSITRD